MRHKLPPDRKGFTKTYHVGKVEMDVTVNFDEAGVPREVFAKSDLHQGEVDGLCILASLALQHDTPPETLVKHMRYRRYGVEGNIGEPCSLSDAIGRALEEAMSYEAKSK